MTPDSIRTESTAIREPRYTVDTFAASPFSFRTPPFLGVPVAAVVGLQDDRRIFNAIRIQVAERDRLEDLRGKELRGGVGMIRRAEINAVHQLVIAPIRGVVAGILEHPE
jgi:hypothetical protein